MNGSDTIPEFKQLDQDNARALFDFIEETSQRFGLKNAPKVVYVDRPIPYAAADPEGGLILVNEGLLSKVFHSPNLNAHVPDGLKAIMAHEVWHVAKDAGHAKNRYIPIFAVPALSLIGYEFYKDAKKRHHDDSSKTIGEHLDDVTEAERQKPHTRWEGQTLEWGKRLAVLAGGLVAGGMISRHMAIANEFRADKMAVLASGNPEAFIDALTQGQKIIREMRDVPSGQWAETASKRTFMDIINEGIEAIKSDLSAVTTHAHPSESTRFDAIRKVARENGLPKC